MLYRLRGHEVGTCILVLTCWPSSVTKIDLTLPRPAKLPVEELDSADNSNEIEGHARANGKSSVLHPSFVAFPSISMPEVLFPPTHTLTRSLSHSMSKISAQIPSSEIVVEFALLSRPEVNRLRLGWFLTWNFQNEAMLPYEYYFLTLCKHWLQISQVAPSAQIPQSSLLPALLICLVIAENSRDSSFCSIYLISGLTAIEAWMLACILFVFGALVEYAAILFRRQKDEVAEVSQGFHFWPLSDLSLFDFSNLRPNPLILIITATLACCRYPTQFIKARLVCTSPEKEEVPYINCMRGW